MIIGCRQGYQIIDIKWQGELKIKSFINYLKNDGFKVVIFYFIIIILCDLSGALISGEGVNKFLLSANNSNIPSVAGVHLTASMIVVGIISFILNLAAMAAAIGSYKELIAGESITYRSFARNGVKYFLSTLGYVILYTLIWGIITLISCAILIFIITKLFGLANESVLMSTTFLIAFQALSTPYIVLKVLEKSTKGYIKTNYKILLLFSLVITFVSYIPVIGRFISTLCNCLYILLILTLHNGYSERSEDLCQGGLQ